MLTFLGMCDSATLWLWMSLGSELLSCRLASTELSSSELLQVECLSFLEQLLALVLQLLDRRNMYFIYNALIFTKQIF